ncbi:fibroblast growth factor receptor-like 1 isoform X2 [Tachypleus tridentatus]|uniref:fibroblast growth factor receptor-like 1 isoform X2 n=1 Tax=Tachypleus tridentatus TaxID=6853 RepID=UPI003FD47FFA
MMPGNDGRIFHLLISHLLTGILALAQSSDVQLPCPVEGDQNSLFIEWYKNRQPLSILGGDHFHVTNRGFLKIRGAVTDDTGLYVCQAVNGFGGLDVNVTLIVLEDDSFRENEDYSSEMLPIDIEGEPELTKTTNFQNGKIQRSVGSSLRLKCLVPTNDHISWLKDGIFLFEGNLPVGSKRGRWYLQLENLRVIDSGNYTCVVRNNFETVHKSFQLEVIEPIQTKPKLTGEHPKNTSVELGETATFQCHVESKIPPHITWLRLLEESELSSQSNVIKLQGRYFKVLNSSVILRRSDGSFISKIQLHDTQESDNGKYFCLGTNAMGYNFRSAFLVVRPQKLANNRYLHPHHSSGSSFRQSSSLPFPIIITVAVVAIIVLFMVIILIFHCRRRTTETPDGNTMKSPCTSPKLITKTGVSQNKDDCSTVTKVYFSKHERTLRYSQPVLR